MASTESTPLVQPVANEVLGSVQKWVSGIFTKDNMDAAGSMAMDKLTKLRQSASNGDFSIRLLALIGGVALVMSAGFGIFGLILTFDLPGAVLEFYTLVLGLIIILLESRGQIQAQKERLSSAQRAQISTQIGFLDRAFTNIHKYAMFSKFVWGRGVLYFVAGSLQLTQSHLTEKFVGCFVMVVGVLYVYVGQQTAAKLNKLRESLAEQTIRSKFQEADQDKDGTLSMSDFTVLTEALGLELSRREREVAFLCMDKNDTGKVPYSDFKAWWADWDEGNSIV